ncbi:hypothetical protein CEXT_531011 [Caerostris extrusa]|uniref:Uncharacterized protein n=1 Tax=Caerostris extrusa TaxID=172846 RepID=A0AAV4RMA0_CAEEX|nr:hypothetical protein CEXT_531011 [Caerostris extrusa]
MGGFKKWEFAVTTTINQTLKQSLKDSNIWPPFKFPLIVKRLPAVSQRTPLSLRKVQLMESASYWNKADEKVQLMELDHIGIS